MTSSASALPSPPAPPKPFSDSPAASQKPRTLEQLAEQRVAVRRHRVGMADERRHAGVVEEREAPHRAGHQRREALVIGREHARAVLPRHAVLPARDRVRLVAAEQHAAALRLAVDEIVGVAEARHVARQLVALDRVQRDVLVVDGDRADERADHRGELRRPHPGRVHDRLRLDPRRAR